MFQSSPGWLAGRCKAEAGVHEFDFAVSILARLVGRALHTTTTWDGMQHLFQSSPGWLAGRCIATFPS